MTILHSYFLTMKVNENEYLYLGFMVFLHPCCGLLSPQLCLEIATSCVSYRFLYVRHPSPPQERRFQPSFLRSSNPATESFSTEWTRHSHPNETHLPCTNTCSLSGFSLFPAIRPNPPAQMSDPGEGGRHVFLLSPSWV